jgi:predicted patatin/cPLA2 family phospholipase
VPFDFETYFNSPERFLVGTTDCETGQSVYFEKLYELELDQKSRHLTVVYRGNLLLVQ